MVTAREIADRVLEARQAAWGRSDPSTVIVATGQLTPDDTAAVRRIVAESGYAGEELEQMVRQVAALVVGKVEALSDKLPATGGD